MTQLDGERPAVLKGRRILITGVATKRSIAWTIAREAQLAGAEVILTSFGRVRSLTERAARALPAAAPVLELDVTRPDDFSQLTETLERRWGTVDGAVHAIAYAPEEAFGFLGTDAESAAAAFQASAFSLKALAEALVPLMEVNGGSIVALDFDASGAWPGYGWMGVCKAALESITRYLARDLGPIGVRANLIAAGPVATPSASSVPMFEECAIYWPCQAPLGWDASDATPVGRSACFLLSDWSAAVTGEILHVDGGYHIMSAPLKGPLREFTALRAQEAS